MWSPPWAYPTGWPTAHARRRILPRSSGQSDGPLYRLLRAVAAIGVLEELPGRRFALTELGEGLRSDVPGSLAGWAAFVGRGYYWAAWSRLIDGVRTGGHAFRLEHGTDPWTYRQTHPEEIPVFNRAMNSVSGQVADSLAAAYDFSQFRTIVDVGGGGGALIAAILGRYSGVRAVLFDLPDVVADARGFIEQAGFAARCELVGGSFFDSVPAGGDAYLLKFVLHDWYDADVKRILMSATRPCGPTLCCSSSSVCWHPPTKGPRASSRTSICWLRQAAVRGLPRNGRRRCVPAVSVGEASPSCTVPR